MTSTLDFPVTPAPAEGRAAAGGDRAAQGKGPAPLTQAELGFEHGDGAREGGAAIPSARAEQASASSGEGAAVVRHARQYVQDERGLVPAVPPSALALLAQAEQGLTAAARQPEAAYRFAEAYLCALRAAAALLAARGRPHRGRAKPTSVWTLLSSVAPELREWAAFFASCSTTRAAVQAGITSRVGPRAADDLVRQSGQFVALVHRAVHGVRR